MNLVLFKLILIAHNISDFVIQSDDTVKLKENFKLKGFFLHILIVFILTFCLLIFYDFKTAVICSLLVVVTHLIIDFFKVCIARKIDKRFDLLLFLLDQILHIIFIYFISINFDFSRVMYFNFSDKILLNIVVYLYIVFAGRFIVEKSLNGFKPVKRQQTELEIKRGKIIGMLERSLIFLLFYFTDIQSMGFIVAIKTLTRFKDLENREFAEYYLIGTLISMIIVILGMCILKNNLYFCQK